MPAGVFAKASAVETDFTETGLARADFSYAVLEKANFQSADLTAANLHAVNDKNAVWTRATQTAVKKTDKDRLEGETWQPPKP